MHELFKKWRGAALLALTLLCLVPASTGSAQDGDADAPAAAATEEAADAPKRSVSYLEWAYNSVPLGYLLIFLAMSFTLVSLIIMNIVKSTRSAITPPDLVDALEAHLDAKQFSEAYELAKGDDSFLGQVFAVGLGKLSGGGDYPRAIEAMQEVGEEENLKLEHRLSYMALIGTVSPMVGLLGTVQGMIASFNVIANTAVTPKPSELALGISTALFTTLIGLAIAIPAIVAYNLLRNRVARLVLEVGVVSEGLLSRIKKA